MWKSLCEEQKSLSLCVRSKNKTSVCRAKSVCGEQKSLHVEKESVFGEQNKLCIAMESKISSYYTVTLCDTVQHLVFIFVSELGYWLTHVMYYKL